MNRQYKHLSALAQLNYSLPCWLCRGRFANLPISYVRDGRVGLALSPHVAEHFKSWNLIASLEKLPLLLRCYGSRWVLCQFLCLTHRSQYQRSTHTWDAFYLLLPATHPLWEIRGRIISNKFRWKAENMNLCTTCITRSSSFEDILRDSRENMNIWQSPLLFVYFSSLPLKNSSREAFSQTDNTLPANMHGSSTYGGILQGRKKNTRNTATAFDWEILAATKNCTLPWKDFPLQAIRNTVGRSCEARKAGTWEHLH